MPSIQSTIVSFPCLAIPAKTPERQPQQGEGRRQPGPPATALHQSTAWHCGCGVSLPPVQHPRSRQAIPAAAQGSRCCTEHPGRHFPPNQARRMWEGSQENPPGWGTAGDRTGWVPALPACGTQPGGLHVSSSDYRGQSPQTKVASDSNRPRRKAPRSSLLLLGTETGEEFCWENNLCCQV